MKGNYFFPLYYQRLLASTMGWKDDEFGAYLKLLIYQFDHGSIPNDMELIGRIAETAKKNWTKISAKFILNEGGNYINLVMDGIRQENVRKSELNTRNGHLGGRPRKRTVIKTETELKANGSCTETERVTETKPTPMVTGLYSFSLEKGEGENFSFSTQTNLPENVLEAAQRNQFALTRNDNTEFLKSQWEVFLGERMIDPEAKNYQSLSDLTSYFLNWIRNKHPAKERQEVPVNEYEEKRQQALAEYREKRKTWQDK